MTKIAFTSGQGRLTGFTITGHTSDNDDETARLVCSAVSSAAYMTVNTITDIIGDKAYVCDGDARMEIKVSEPSEKTAAVLDGFKLHMTQLEKQFDMYIKVKTEV